MDFHEYWNRVRDHIDAQCAVWIPEFFEEMPPAENASIHGSLAAGKRLRGSLACLVCEALGGTLEAAVPRAVAIECIQAASLMHDDFVDGDRVRRERPAAWTVEGARRAVLLADVMFATVIHRMAESGQRDGSVVARAIAGMARGAYRELRDQSEVGLALEAGTYRRERYESVIRGKSGSLFGAAAELGAVAAGAAAPVADRAREFGVRVGEIYQIADDLAEVAVLARSPAPAAGNRWALAAALLYFSDAPAASVLELLRGTSARPPTPAQGRILRRAQHAMQREITARLEGARALLDELPANRYTRLLRAMPEEVVGMMQAQAPGADAHSRATG